jgi:hypothetical protein
MQPLIQSILSQIIDFCFYFPERLSDFSNSNFPQELQLLHLKTKQKMFSHYGQQFAKNAKNGFDFLKLI